MKRCCILIFMMLFLSCTSKKLISGNNFTTIIGGVDKSDTKCLSEVNQAKSDFKKKEVYSYISGGCTSLKSTRYHPEFKELLHEKNIEFRWESGPETETILKDGKPYILNFSCYQRAMNKMIEKKYGADFILNLEKQADSLYVLRRTDEVFSYAHIDDTLVVYVKSKAYRGMRTQINNDFLHDFKIPDGFLDTGEKNNFVSAVQFTIYKDGSISDFVIKTTFKNPGNNKFKAYFEKEIIAFLKGSQWKAATVHKITVHSSMPLTLHDENYFSQ
nr:hypothetical protein [uncultured Flavobacterium sp.]